MRKFIKEQLMSDAVSSIVIERAWNSVRITVHTARPGLVTSARQKKLKRQGFAALPPRSTLTSETLKRTPSLSLRTWPSSWNAVFPSAAP